MPTGKTDSREKKPAHVPPSPGPLRALIDALDAARAGLDDANIDELVSAHEQWHEFNYHARSPEDWVGAGVAFALRGELRTLHAELSAEREDGGHLLYTDDGLAARVLPVILASPAALLFIDECHTMVSSFVPTKGPAFEQARREWYANVVREVAWIVGNHTASERDDVMGIGERESARIRNRLERVRKALMETD